MNRDAEPKARVNWLRVLPYALVSVVGFALLWPVPLGRMPMSADHTVHLARAQMWSGVLAEGHLAAWSDMWFLGFPLGEFYPPLGDALIVGVHTLGLGLLSWPAAYALAFTIVFCLQGWVLVRLAQRAAGDLGGAIAGTVAGALILLDPGFSREGGWMYTVYFGVWPQVFATSLVWLGLGELAPGGNPEKDRFGRIGRAGWWSGLGLLAHPIALPMLVVGFPLLWAVFAIHDRGRVRVWTTSVLVAGLGALALAAWWWVPMLLHRDWMASYGWLHAPLETMAKWLLEGKWAQHMAPAIGWTLSVGIVLVGWKGRPLARFLAVFALVLWALASRDVFWDLRLDRLSEGFTRVQWQRFLIAAKPGLFFCAGALVGMLGELALVHLRPDGEKRAPRRAKIRRAVGIAGAIGALAGLGAIVQGTLSERGHELAPRGSVQLERMPDDPEFEADYQEFLEWARARWDEREEGERYRIAFAAGRNEHWFMDASVWTRTPTYKAGFTPGDNFVHKPEAQRHDVLDVARVRYMVRRVSNERPQPHEVARFGAISVSERKAPTRGDAWVEGDPTQPVEVLEHEVGKRIKVRVPEGAESITFNIAGHPRWSVRRDEEPPSLLDFNEEPIWGRVPPASAEKRASGALAGGRALGDDGREPILLAVETRGARTITLEYQTTRSFDVLAGLLSLFAGLVLLVPALPFDRLAPLAERAQGMWRRVLAPLDARLHPALVGVLALTLLAWSGMRWQRAAAAEEGTAHHALDTGASTDVDRMRVGPLKVDMSLHPAVLPHRRKTSELRISNVTLGERLTGWIGLDDDEAKNRRRGTSHELSLEIEVEGHWHTLDLPSVPARPGRVHFEVDTREWQGQEVTLRVVSEPSGKRPPRFGFDLRWSE